jgi:hypothetical protein
MREYGNRDIRQETAYNDEDCGQWEDNIGKLK